MATIHMDLVTPERRLISTEVDEVKARAAKGEFEVLPGHSNYITLLDIGELSYRESGNTKHVAVTGGFAEVTLEEGIRIMAECAECAEEIDTERAEAAKERAEKRLQESDPSGQGIDLVRAQAALQRSMVRLGVARKG
ncbi:MAG: F0F1 ATP synthase subunit epsilon [bacterium]